MSLLFAVFLGLVQGITEFLPVSSSGHLAILQNFFGMQNVEQNHLFFDVLLHLGTLSAVCVAYWKDIVEMAQAFWGMICTPFHKGRQNEPKKEQVSARRLLLLIIIATVPLVFVIPLSDFIGDLYKNNLFVGLALIITGFIIFLSDRMPRGEKTVLQSTWKDALVIGIMQIFATLPGISRSGITISAGLFRGFDRKYAVKFSFLMSLPAILGANIFSLADAAKAGIDTSMIPIYLAGMLAAAVSGYFAIQLMRYIANKNKFGKFAVYCIIVGALIIILSLFGL